MKRFHIHALPDSSVLALMELRNKLNLSPEYQRPGGVWSLNKRQLFIDSLLNGYDIPKLYFHHLSGKYADKKFEYAIIDGRQRLEAIWEFVDGRLALGEDFKFFEDEGFKAAGMTFTEIQEEYPRLLIRFQARNLAVMVVTTDDLDFIEDMFSRLNEAVPLNAAEKRNALGGPLPKIIKEVAAHPFFTDKIPFPATRYRHYDVAAKLLVEQNAKGVVDTKKARLDYFVVENRHKKKEDFASLEKATRRVLDRMTGIFSDNDPLLRSSGMVVVYYTMLAKKFVDNVSRAQLVKFEKARENNREKFEREEKNVNFTWIEYDELAQSANDGAAIKARAETLAAYLKGP